MKDQAGIQVSRPGELKRQLQLWKRFGRLYSIVFVLVRTLCLGSLPVPLKHVNWKPGYKGSYTKEEEATGQWPTEIRLTDPIWESHDDKPEHQDLTSSNMKTVGWIGRAIIKEDVNNQLPQILPTAISNFATPMIEKNVTESLEVSVLAKRRKTKSYLRVDYKRELYDALVNSYNTDKDLFDTYGEAFILKRGQDDKDKDQDPSARLDRGKKRKKLSKERESSKDPRSKE
ncbi:hypothetical protein Tco_1485568 [Tanacetum coccineum]